MRLIGQILGSPKLKLLANSGEPIRIEREVHVPWGHVDQTGRLDVVIYQGAETIAVVEVKTREYSDEDLKKHKGYSEWLAATSPEAELVFLAIEDTNSDTFRFRFISWANVCIALRAIAARLMASEQILGTSLVLAFIGAVEQNLLGLASPSAGTIPIGRIPRMADHLAKAEQAEVAHGQW